MSKPELADLIIEFLAENKILHAHGGVTISSWVQGSTAKITTIYLIRPGCLACAYATFKIYKDKLKLDYKWFEASDPDLFDKLHHQIAAARYLKRGGFDD